jgi:hypothetical protein
MMDKNEAQKMWDDLRGHLVSAERAIPRIIEARAWEPLGYASFAAAWAGELQGVKLATDALRAVVLYAMFDGGLTAAEAAEHLPIGSGVSPMGVERLREQYDAGVPCDFASTRVRSHRRRLPSEAQTIHVKVKPGELQRYKEIADAAGSTLDREAERAISLHFARLAREALKVG